MKDRLLSIWKKISDRKYYRYYLAVLVIIVIVVVLVKCTGTKAEDDNPMAGAYQDFTNQTETSVKTDDETDESNVIQTLINTYYTAYAAGDLDTLSTVADPFSDREKSYIQFFSQYLEEYQDITVYTKRGMDQSSYLVSVSMKIKFVDIDTPAPGLDFFYISTNDEGNLYINNLYSAFNTANGENDMDPDITALIATFEQQDDVVALQEQVQQEFNDALLADEALSNFLNTTLSDETTKWATEYNTKKAEEEAAAAQAEAEAQAQAEAEAAAQAAEAEAAAQAEAEAAEAEAETETESADGEITVDGLEAGSTITMTDTLNMRSEQSADSSLVDIAYVSEPVTIIANYSSGWTQIRNVRDEVGYVKTEYLQ